MSNRYDDAVMGVSRELLNEILAANPDVDEAVIMLMMGGAVAGRMMDIFAGRHPSPVALDSVQDFRDFADSAASFFAAAVNAEGVSELCASFLEVNSSTDGKGPH